MKMRTTTYQHFTSMMDYEEEAARLDQNANEHTPITDAEIEEDLSEVVAPAMSQCCVIKMATQDTSAVIIDAIHETLASPPPRQTHDSPTAENHNDNAPLRMQREGEPLNDYTGGPELLYKTSGPLMPLRRGFNQARLYRKADGAKCSCSTTIVLARTAPCSITWPTHSCGTRSTRQ